MIFEKIRRCRQAQSPRAALLSVFLLSLLFCSFSVNDAFLASPSVRCIRSLKAATLEDVATLEQLTVKEIKDKLKVRGLPMSGVKSILIERLVEDFSNKEKEENTGEDYFVPEGDSGFVTSDDDDDDDADNAEITETDKGTIVEHNPSKGVESEPPAKKAATFDLLPPPLQEALARRTTNEKTTDEKPTLLPVQARSFLSISSGSDAVLFAPTGSGKTLGYVLPLFARLFEWKRTGKLKKRKRMSEGEYYSVGKRREPSHPSILVLAPSRELAKQVAKVLQQFHPTSSGRVAAVFGGVPIERHVSLLRRELDVIVGTPGRVRELIREGHLTTDQVKSIVLDEADVLLNFDDQPEIEMLLQNMQNDYQLVLASATVNQRVRKFVTEVMEIDEKSDAFVVVGGVGIDNQKVDTDNRPKVSHWSTAARSSARPGLAADMIATMSPRVGIIFTASKVESESVAEDLTEKLPDVKVSVLHGDMSQSARSRTVAALRDDSNKNRRKILVATDIASRGLDLPGVDLVLQFGIPRQSGKEGTYDSELYRHRAGRAGRVGGGSRPADAVLLYDPAEGESKVLPKLSNLLETVGIQIETKPLPSPSEVMEASYSRAEQICKDVSEKDSFVNYFKEKITSELDDASTYSERETELLDRLAAAMANLSGLDGVVTQRSLLTAEAKDRTIRIWSKESGASLNPPEVIRFAKGLGSGKLGRVTICKDGSGVFDLPVKRAERLLQTYVDKSTENIGENSLRLEIPSALPQ